MTRPTTHVKVSWDPYDGEDGAWNIATSRDGTGYSEALRGLDTFLGAQAIATSISKVTGAIVVYGKGVKNGQEEQVTNG